MGYPRPSLLVAKCIMKQFDSPKKKDSEDNDDKEDDMHREMSAEEVEDLEKSVKPVRCVLTKVR